MKNVLYACLLFSLAALPRVDAAAEPSIDLSAGIAPAQLYPVVQIGARVPL